MSKMYRLMTDIQPYSKGAIFTFEQKHAFMATLDWTTQRAILWETITVKDLH